MSVAYGTGLRVSEIVSLKVSDIDSQRMTLRLKKAAGLGMLSLGARARGRLYEWKLLHRFALVMGPSGLVAVLAGWLTTEVGRQPWTIQRLMRTAESASPLAAPAVAASLLAFVIVYFAYRARIGDRRVNTQRSAIRENAAPSC